MRNSKAPEVNAGSMADIAFLLLIFFLVTAVIPNDKGIARKLPPLCLEMDCSEELSEQNVLRISLNASNQIFVQNEIISIETFKNKIKAFVDNNGDKSCNYCKGLNLNKSSDNPKKAVISFQVHPETFYNTFIKVQDELSKAYYELRKQYALNILGKHIDVLNSEDIKTLKKAYPFKVSEAEVK
ncbi:biopolymer transporter ExbD [Flavobacteriaceae bacterium AU392]|nr:biopolymer transporter ExbD [Flavobacteriaceae bacterium]RKM85649.1 biopolymer transporter ExbD [Flavobacteriaceae bacterium AU392]